MLKKYTNSCHVFTKKIMLMLTFIEQNCCNLIKEQSSLLPGPPAVAIATICAKKVKDIVHQTQRPEIQKDTRIMLLRGEQKVSSQL